MLAALHVALPPVLLYQPQAELASDPNCLPDQALA